MKVYDLYGSIFVGFCIGSFLAAFLSVLLRPIVSDEVSLPILGASFLTLWSILVCFLSGAGYGERANRLVMSLAGIVGWLFLAAGFVGFGLEAVTIYLSSFLAVILFYGGSKQAGRPWIHRILIIKKVGLMSETEIEGDSDDLQSTWED